MLVPGAICAVPVVKPLDIERGTEDLRPLAFWLGHTSAAPHLTHFKSLLTSLVDGLR